MNNIKIFVDENGKSNIFNYVTVLLLKNDKDSNIKRQKILDYIKLLSYRGVAIGYPYVKHITGKIWELRPLDLRILFFKHEEEYILLNIFRKTTKKTPLEEIDKAKRYMKSYIERQEKNER